MHIFSTFPCYLKCSLKILSLSNNTVSEQLSRDSYVKWSGIDILFLIPARLILPGVSERTLGVLNTNRLSSLIPAFIAFSDVFGKAKPERFNQNLRQREYKDKINKILLFWGYMPEIPAVVFYSGTMICYETLKFLRRLGDIEMTVCQHTGDEY